LHVPDGPLPLWVYLVFLVVSLSILGVSIRRINRKFDDRMVPYLGVLAAVIFAAQLVNFPLPPTSGHLVGSTLLAVMVGPFAAVVIMAQVLLVQALYGDGGFLAFGLNLFNMGVFASFFGWFVALVLFKTLKRAVDEKVAVLIATTIASFVSTVASAFVLGLELMTIPGFGLEALIVIVVVHAFIGVGEAVLTFFILLYFIRAKPQLISFLSGSKTAEIAKVADAPWANPQEVMPVTVVGGST